MTSVDQAARVALDNPLGWQGWWLDLPRQWNPARLTGNDRRGTISVLDLEQARLELCWRRVRSTRGIDLRRVSPAGAAPGAAWRSDQRQREGMAGLRWVVGENGDTIALALSQASKRLAFLRIFGGPNAPSEDTVARILDSFVDTSGRAEQPWCIYGLAWKVPNSFRLTGYQLAAGRAELSFRQGRRRLEIERWLLRARDAVRDATEGVAHQDDNVPMEVRGHQVRVYRATKAKSWPWIIGRPGWRAEWECQVSGRAYRVTASGPEALALLTRAAGNVLCHSVADGT